MMSHLPGKKIALFFLCAAFSGLSSLSHSADPKKLPPKKGSNIPTAVTPKAAQKVTPQLTQQKRPPMQPSQQQSSQQSQPAPAAPRKVLGNPNVGASKPLDGVKIVKKPMRTFRPYGLQLSYLSTKMDANFTANGANQKASMQGTGLGFLGYYDFPMSDTFQVRGALGFEQFYASESKSTAICGSSTTNNCDVKINYLSAYGQGKVMLSRGRAPTFVAAGIGQLVALSKSSTVLDSGSISGNFVYIASLGVDLTLGSRVGAPFSLDYVIFNSSAAVAASFIGLRAGVSWW